MNISLDKLGNRYPDWKFFLEEIRSGKNVEALRNLAIEKRLDFVDSSVTLNKDAKWNAFLDTLESIGLLKKTIRTGSAGFYDSGQLIIRFMGVTPEANALLDDYFEEKSSSSSISFNNYGNGPQQNLYGNHNTQNLNVLSNIEDSIKKLIEENESKYGNQEISDYLEQALSNTGQERKNALLKTREIASSITSYVPKMVDFVANISQIISSIP